MLLASIVLAFFCFVDVYMHFFTWLYVAWHYLLCVYRLKHTHAHKVREKEKEQKSARKRQLKENFDQ